MKYPDLEKEIENLLLLNYVPASILLDKDFQIIKFYGPTSQYLLPYSGEASIPLEKMVRSGLLQEVELLIAKVKNENTSNKKQNIEFDLNGILTKVDIGVIPIRAASSDSHFLVSFQSSESQNNHGIIANQLSDSETKSLFDKDLKQKDNTINEQDLEEREEKFRALMQNAFDVITIFNYDGTITYQSDSIEKVLGYTAAERIGKNIFVDSTVFPEDRGIEKKLFQKCLDTPYNIFRDEFRMVAKDGSLKIMEVSCVNLAHNSNVRGIIKNYRDVTEKRLMDKQKEDFIGVASHELKTPVTSIKAYTQILHENLTSKNDLESAGILLKMENQINRLTNLINDLLDVTKINEGKLKLKKEELDINELIKHIADDMQMTTKRHTINLDLQKVAPIQADHEKISQVLVNFISNAIKYSPSSNQINIKSLVNANDVTVSVQDFGIGISKEIHKNLFKRFFRFKDESTRTFPGLGLGLYISAEIIKRHQGKIWAESAPNEGASFCFTLPI
jgi:PAS domain S-box-containing protein